jgi:hypothetical protein
LNTGKSTRNLRIAKTRLFHALIFTAVIFLASLGTCFATNVALQWNASADSSVTGYKVYYQADSSSQPFKGTGAINGASPIDVQNLTSTTISGLDPSRVYYFAVTAYNASGIESPYSNIASIPQAPFTAPSASSAVKGDVNGDGVVDVTDALLVMQAVTNSALQTPALLASADVAPLDANGVPVGDGQITLADALLILQKAVGLIKW